MEVLTTPAPPKDRTTGPMAVRDRFADAKAMVKSAHPVLVDGGAHIGRMTARFCNDYPTGTVHAFEPIPPLAQHLQQQFAQMPNVHVHAAALGAQSKPVEFNVVGNMMSSSVYKPSAFADDLHGDAVAIMQTVTVPQVRLDEVIDTPIDVMKLDLQGYELEALKGAEKLLDRVHIIIAEVDFTELYDNQPLFGDIDAYLRAHGFALWNLYELWTLETSQLTSGDAMYVRKGA